MDNMDQRFLQNDSDLQLSLSALQGNFNYVPYLAENTLYQQHTVRPEDYNNYYVPQSIEYQQMDPYFEYLAGNGISDMQREIPYDSTGIGCSFMPEESFLSMDAYQVKHPWLQHEEVPVNNFANTQHEICYQKQGPNEGLDNAAQHQPNMSASTSRTLKKTRNAYSKQKAIDSDRRRRIRIAAAQDALEDLLPQSQKGNKTHIADDCITYIKYLQLRMKELSQHRLGGEPTSNYLRYIEGHGHYLVHDNTTSGPLQDILGKLLQENPSEAAKLLESRGLYMRPFAPN